MVGFGFGGVERFLCSANRIPWLVDGSGACLETKTNYMKP
jgi:hypothetical protein